MLLVRSRLADNYIRTGEVGSSEPSEATCKAILADGLATAGPVTFFTYWLEKKFVSVNKKWTEMIKN